MQTDDKGGGVFKKLMKLDHPYPATKVGILDSVDLLS